jgi:hypothetical protein
MSSDTSMVLGHKQDILEMSSNSMGVYLPQSLQSGEFALVQNQLRQDCPAISFINEKLRVRCCGISTMLLPKYTVHELNCRLT